MDGLSIGKLWQGILVLKQHQKLLTVEYCEGFYRTLWQKNCQSKARLIKDENQIFRGKSHKKSNVFCFKNVNPQQSAFIEMKSYIYIYHTVYFIMREIISDSLLSINFWFCFQPHTVQCVLPLNLFNEKIFLFLWFWFILVTVITCSNLLFWFWRSLFQRNRTFFVKKYLTVRSR